MGAWRTGAPDDLARQRWLLDQTLVMPARGRILIKKPDTEETLPGGSIIIPEKSREAYAANQYEVVEVGEPSECCWPDDCNRFAHQFPSAKLCVHPIDSRIKPGAWIVVRPRSLVDAGAGLFVILQDDVLGVFTDDIAEANSEAVHEVRGDQTVY